MAELLESPVFIGGSGRSGTFAVERLLTQHPVFFNFCKGEAKLFSERHGLLELYRGLVDDYNPARSLQNLRAFENYLLNELPSNNAQILHLIDEHDFRSIVQKCTRSFLRATTPKKLADHEFFILIRSFMEEYLQTLRKPASASRFIEKTPTEILHINFIRKIFPSAKFIHVVRDPRDVVASVLRMPWGPSELEPACWWLKSHHEAYQAQFDAQPILREVVIDVRVEDIDSAAFRKNLELFLELDTGTLASIHRPPYGPDKNPFYWLDHMSPEELHLVFTVLGDEISRYNYPT